MASCWQFLLGRASAHLLQVASRAKRALLHTMANITQFNHVINGAVCANSASRVRYFESESNPTRSAIFYRHCLCYSSISSRWASLSPGLSVGRLGARSAGARANGRSSSLANLVRFVRFVISHDHRCSPLLSCCKSGRSARGSSLAQLGCRKIYLNPPNS